MTTSEFKERIIVLGYNYDDENFRGGLRVLSNNGIVAFTKTNKFGTIDTNWGATEMLSDSSICELLHILVEYATTPISSRGNEK